MSVSRPQVQMPAAKRVRLNGASAAVTRTASCAILPTAEEESVPPTATQSSTVETENKPQVQSHPKGHKVFQLSKVWESMDKQNFLHLTDTYLLADVWVQPTLVTPMNATYADVTFKHIVVAPHIKQRLATTKMSTEDLLKMLYLADYIQWSMQGVCGLSFEDWEKEKSAACVKVKGMAEGSNRALLCNFIINEDREFTFYPQFLHGNFGIFFRKTCVHSYKTDDAAGKKLTNPSMIKCTATRGKFEYVLEARLIALPDGWFDDEEAPATLPMDGPLGGGN